jgi:phage gpG-like protein
VAQKLPIRVVNLAEFKKQLSQCSAAARGEALLDTVEAGARVIETYAKINVEKTFSNKSTGGLAGSIMVTVKGGGNKAEAEIGPTKIYGRIQELGGVIKPVTAKMLHWVEDGQDIFARVVHIPARPYLRPAVDEHIDDIREAMVNTLMRKIAQAVGR